MDFSDQELERYSRQIILREFGGTAQIRFKSASVLIIGAGGLGLPVAMHLSGAGVGHIKIVDDDRVDRSNLPRQNLFEEADLGALKAETAAQRLMDRNSDVQVTGLSTRIDETNAADLTQDVSMVIDGSDNFATRLLVADAAVNAALPLVSGAVAGYEGQIATFHPQGGDTYPCYRCLVPEHPGAAADRTCSDMGILSPVTGHIAALMAFEALRELAGLKGGLKGKLRISNLLTGVDRTIGLPRDPNCKTCGDIER